MCDLIAILLKLILWLLNNMWYISFNNSFIEARRFISITAILANSIDSTTFFSHVTISPFFLFLFYLILSVLSVYFFFERERLMGVENETINERGKVRSWHSKFRPHYIEEMYHEKDPQKKGVLQLLEK